MRALLDRKGVMLDVADDISVALEKYIAAADWTFDPAVHYYLVSFDPARDGSFMRDDK